MKLELMSSFVPSGIGGFRRRGEVRCCAEPRRMRRVSAIVQSQEEVALLGKAARGLEYARMDVFRERELELDVGRLVESLEASDVFLYFPKKEANVALGECLIPIVESCYSNLSVCLFLPTYGMDYLTLNKLNVFDAERLLRGRFIDSSLVEGTDAEAAERTFKRLPELLSLVSTSAADSVKMLGSLASSWQQSTQTEFELASQMALTFAPQPVEISVDEVEREVEQLLEGKESLSPDIFVSTRKHYLLEAIESHYGGLDAVCQQVVESRREEKRMRASRLKFMEKNELENALLEFNKLHHGKPSKRMPSEHELHLRGRSDLRKLVLAGGGFEAVASDMGLLFTDEAIDRNFPSFEALDSEIRSFIERRMEALDKYQIDTGRLYMPRYADFRAEGREDIVQAIRAYGGMRLVARAMDLRLHSTSTHRFQGDFNGLCRALVDLKEQVMPGSQYLPTLTHLKELGRLDLVAGIKEHGGVSRVASTLGLKMLKGAKVMRDREGDVNWLRDQLQRFAKAFMRMPTMQELLDHGRIDLVRAIRRHGGREHAAQLCGLTAAYDLTLLSDDFGEMGVCESNEALTFSAQTGQRTLSRDALGTYSDGDRRDRHYFRDFSKVKSELFAFIFDCGDQGVMPTAKELITSGRGDLLRGIKLHGGQKVVARKLGLVFHSQGRKAVRNRHRQKAADMTQA